VKLLKQLHLLDGTHAWWLQLPKQECFNDGGSFLAQDLTPLDHAMWDERSAVVSGTLHTKYCVSVLHLEDVIALYSVAFELVIKVIKHIPIVHEHGLLGINDAHILLGVEGLHGLAPRKDVILVVFQLHLVEEPIASVLGVSVDVKHKLHGLEVTHLHQVQGQMQDNIVFVLTATIVHCGGQLLPWMPFPEPELAMYVLQEKGCNIVASLLRRKFPVGITL
jgi:hypothetical protein